MADSGQRTEEPTQRRLEKARKDGQFPVSREFVSAVQFIVFVAVAIKGFPAWLVEVKHLTAQMIRVAFERELTRQATLEQVWNMTSPVFVPMLTLGAILAVSTMAVQLGTTRLGFATGKLAPDLNRLNPLSKLKQLPQQNVPQFLQALVLLPLFMLAVWVVVSENTESFLRLPLSSLPSGLAQVGSSITDLLWKAAGLFAVVGCIDLIRQRRRWNSELRMSKQDIREESKESDGDPHIKMRIRRMQRDLLRRQMMKSVDTASAVIVNPTHFAIAIRYVPSEMPAPKVVAKGKNYLALRIRDRALRNQVPIIENPPLARALYASAEVGQEIPANLYRAVAEVLAYLYRLAHGRFGGK